MVVSTEAYDSRVDRFVPPVAWILAGLTTIGVVLMLGIFAGSQEELSTFDLFGGALFVALPIPFAVTAAAILSKQPRNQVGWALLIPALGSVLGSALDFYYTTLGVPTSLPWWGILALAFGTFSWVLLIFPIFHLMLIFPTGRVLSTRWRFFVWLEGAMIAVMAALAMFSDEVGPTDGAWSVPNPVGFIPVDIFNGLFAVVWTAGLLVLALAGVLCLILRYRRAGRVERLQLKWMLAAVVVFGIVYSIGAIFSSSDFGGWANIALSLSLYLLPVSIAFGVLKYRLFDIDRLVSRTVGYVIVVGLLALVYVGLAVWLPSRFLSGDSPFFVAAATLAVAALFNPVRRSVLRWVDRRFYRSRYDMERLVENFANSLQNRTDLDGLTDDWVGIVTETLQPSAVGVWIKG